jgi:hypothetical protein
LALGAGLAGGAVAGLAEVLGASGPILAMGATGAGTFEAMGPGSARRGAVSTVCLPPFALLPVGLLV